MPACLAGHPFSLSFGSLGFQQERYHASIGKTTGLTAPMFRVSHPGHRPLKLCVVVSCFPNNWQASPRFLFDDGQIGSYRSIYWISTYKRPRVYRWSSACLISSTDDE